MNRLAGILVACLGWSLASASSAEQAAFTRSDLTAFVDGFVRARMESEQVVGVTVSIVHDGRLLLARGYGYDDLAGGRAVDPDRSMFRTGSISKTFTWTAVMQLVEQGRLDLNTDVRRYLPDLDIPDTFAEPITLSHLMAHTPGFEDSVLGHLFRSDPDHVLSLHDYLARYQPARVRPPGQTPAYSNYGAALAGLVVANVAGTSWEDYAERHLFRPLGMRNSTFREPWGAQRPDALPERQRRNVSRGYVRRDGGFEPGPFEFIGHAGPAGALATTATDMARWMLAHLQQGEFGGGRILQPETARRMHTQHFTLDPDMPGLAHGFIESHVNGYRAIGHGGGTVYFLSDMQLVPELGLGVFISANTAGGGGALIGDFVRLLVLRYFPPGPGTAAGGRPVEVTANARYAGSYLANRRSYTTVERLLNNTLATVTAGPRGSLVVSSPLGEARFVPAGVHTFRSLERGETIKFRVGADGVADAMLLPMPIVVMERVGPLDNPSFLYLLLLGAAAVLACVPVGAWLRRRRAPPQAGSERWAGALAVCTALAWLGCFGLALAGLAPIARDLSLALFAFPSPAFVAALGVALGATALTLASMVMLVPVWRVASWPLGRRVRHTLVVLTALLVVVVLWRFNAIGFHFLGD